ncbi:hypothetical protein L873DRAFT_1796778 [Choiromyces venosus 120613-1]|uniref:Calcium channel YVC1-like C-terminal transmembrane domain-containing protein n=1 Tax=Choiromyces venosus 120613-1 TaxID=1336337 RepID=A0A3N4K9F1_9PEZI|nr:hypothetical protein L873DRAFT_1796778 [Choiromyces venosus 120613-1]
MPNKRPLSLHEVRPTTPMTPMTPTVVKDDMNFLELCETFRNYFVEYIDTPQNMSTLKLSPVMTRLCNQLSERGHNRATVAALLWCKAHFDAEEDDFGGHGLGGGRGLACEFVASDLLTSLSANDALEYLCYELPLASKDDDDGNNSAGDETAGLLGGRGGRNVSSPDLEADSIASFAGLNTLEIAILADAKKFLSHRPVERVINGIWEGRISFWKTLDVDGSKKPHFYNKRKADPFCRLRVPKYQKAFEAFFFAVFLALYYGVLIQRDPYHITGLEAALIVFFVAFAVDEISSIRDAGTAFYTADFWSLWDVCIIIIGIAFLIWRIVGIVKDNDEIVDTAFDILSLEALLLIPRVCSLLSMNPYFGVLIPCLKQMTKDFLKFVILVAILYLGFLTTFSLLARESFTLSEMSWMLIKVFFGSSSVGFDAMREISPVLGPPLMLIFVTLTNILLITSLISLLSNSLTNMMNNAREEYLFMFSITVMEAATSNRLVVFYPPMNLLSLILLRPLRLVLSANRMRKWRIALLKFSHFPFVAAIMAYESLWPVNQTRSTATAWGPSTNSKRMSMREGLKSFGRRPDRLQEWSGRLNGGRLGLGGAGSQVGPHAGPALLSSASSMRMDFDGEGASNMKAYANQIDEHGCELHRMRTTIEQLSRKLDEVLAQKSP